MFAFSTAVWFWMMLATVFQSATALPTDSLFARQGSCLSVGRATGSAINPVHTGRQEITPALRAGNPSSYYNPDTEIEIRLVASTWPQNNLATFHVENSGAFDQTVYVEAHLEGPAANHPNVVLSHQIASPAFQTTTRCLNLPPGHRWYVRAVRGPSRKE